MFNIMRELFAYADWVGKFLQTLEFKGQSSRLWKIYKCGLAADGELH